MIFVARTLFQSDAENSFECNLKRNMFDIHKGLVQLLYFQSLSASPAANPVAKNPNLVKRHTLSLSLALCVGSHCKANYMSGF